MPKVYVPQVPSRFDTSVGMWVPSVNMSPAARYGDMCIMLPPDANRLHVAPLVAAMKEQMKDFTEDDYIVAVGDPSLIAAAAVIATRKASGVLRILKWDRIRAEYIPVEIQP